MAKILRFHPNRKKKVTRPPTDMEYLLLICLAIAAVVMLECCKEMKHEVHQPGPSNSQIRSD